MCLSVVMVDVTKKKWVGLKNRIGNGCNTRPNGNEGRTGHARSKQPENIDAWEDVSNTSGLSPFSTYVTSVKMETNGDIYLIYRHGAHKSDWVYQKSTNGCRSFGPVTSILQSYKVRDIQGREARHIAAWYMHCFSPGSSVAVQYKHRQDVIGCQFTHHYHKVGQGTSTVPHYAKNITI